MKPQLGFCIVIALIMSALAPAPARAQLGAGRLGDIVNKKLDKSGEAIAAAGATDAQGKSGKPGDAKATGSAASSPEVVTQTVLRLEIGRDVLTNFSSAVTAEAVQRDIPAKRNRCATNLENSSEMMLLMGSAKPLLERVAASTMPEEQKQAELARIASAVAGQKTEMEVTRCGVSVLPLDAMQYLAIGALGGGFTPEQYLILKQRVAPFCEALETGADAPADPKLVYAELEKSALRSRCRVLLPTLRKVL